MMVYLTLTIVLAFFTGRSQSLSIPSKPGSDALNFVILGDWGGLPCPLCTTPLQTTIASSMGKTAAETGASFAVALGKETYVLFRNIPLV